MELCTVIRIERGYIDLKRRLWRVREKERSISREFILTSELKNSEAVI